MISQLIFYISTFLLLVRTEGDNMEGYDFSNIPKKVYIKVTHKSLGGDDNPKTIVFDLNTKDCPFTTYNFTQIITGKAMHKGKNISYKNAIFHRIIENFMIQGGNIVNGNGTGSYSVYGREFDDEILEKNKHELGSLSMANKGLNTNGCQFFIVTGNCDHLNGKHTVFGKLADNDSYKIVLELSKVAVDKNHKPFEDVKIVDCGIHESIDEEHNDSGFVDESDFEESDTTSSEKKLMEEESMQNKKDERL